MKILVGHVTKLANPDLNMFFAMVFVDRICIFYFVDWLQAVRVFESIALISSMVAIATVLFQMMVNKFSKNKFVFLVNIISCFATGEYYLKV